MKNAGVLALCNRLQMKPHTVIIVVDVQLFFLKKCSLNGLS